MNNIGQLIVNSLQDKQKPFLICESGELTQGEFVEQVKAKAKLLQQHFAPNDVCFVVTGREADYWVDMTAVWYAGLVTVPLDHKSDNARVEQLMAQAKPKAILGEHVAVPSPACRGGWGKIDYNALPLAPSRKREGEQFGNISQREGEQLDNISKREEEQLDNISKQKEELHYSGRPEKAQLRNMDCAAKLAMTDEGEQRRKLAGEAYSAGIFFTSGSTGQPKGVVNTHQALIDNAISSAAALYDFKNNDRLLIALGFQFISAISHFIVAALKGATLIAIERPLFSQDLMDCVKKYNATAFGGSPVQIKWLGEHTDIKLNWAMSSGDHLSIPIIEAFQTTHPETALYTVYGLTELAGRFCVLDPSLLKDKKGSAGRPIDGFNIKILSDDMAPCASFEIGHVFAEGDMVFEGYLGKDTPELTEHGFKTGDIGYLDDEGFVFLSGRSDHVFKSAGLKVSTLPITEALIATEVFKDVIVLGIEDETFGKIPIAFYVEKTPGAFHKGSVLKTLRKTLPNNHLPKKFIALDAIPRTGSGKPKFKELKGIYKKPDRAG